MKLTKMQREFRLHLVQAHGMNSDVPQYMTQDELEREHYRLHEQMLADTGSAIHQPGPQVKRIIQRQGVFHGHITEVWVGLGELDPNREDPEDHTLPEITHKYMTKRALVAAIHNGTAFKEQS